MAASGTGIPLSGGTGMDAFDQGFKNMQSAIDSIRQNQYRTGALAVQQQELQQKQTMLPYMIQKYADEHNLTPYHRQLLQAQAQEALQKAASDKDQMNMLNNIFKMGQTTPQPGINPASGAVTPQGQPPIANGRAHFGDPNATQGGDEGLINVNAQGGIIDPRQTEQPPMNEAQANAPSANPMTTPNNPDIGILKGLMSKQGLMSAAPDMMPETNPDDDAPALPPINNGQSQQLTPATSQTAPNGNMGQIQDNAPINNAESKQTALPKKIPTNVGEVIEVKPATPGRESLDNMPVKRLNIHGVEVDFTPKETKLGNGITETRYPSGRITREKVEPSFEEKQAIAEKNRSDLAYQQEKAKADLEDERQQHRNELIDNKTNKIISDNLEGNAKDYKKSADILIRLNKLLKDNPNLTSATYGIPFGIGSGLKRTTNDEDFGAFNSGSGDLQGQIAKNVTGRNTGKASLIFASARKPDVANMPKTNEGLITENARQLKDAYEEDKEQYERINNGKKFPFELPKEINDIIESADKRHEEAKNTRIANNQKSKQTVINENNKPTSNEWHKIGGKWEKIG